MNENTLRASLAHLPIPELRFFESAGSTNDLALKWIETGAPDGGLVVANAQTAGRGRMNRSWVTLPDSALAFSLVLRPAEEYAEKLPFYAPLAGLAVSLALENLGLAPEIKWPNDVLLNRRKVCGILVEAVWNGSQPAGLVIGIGVNVAPSSVPPDGEVMYPAGCVEQALGKPADRTELLASILTHLFDQRPAVGSPSFIQAWDSRLAFRGELVRVEPPGQPAQTGILQGIDQEGCLVLRRDENNVLKISAGDVARLRPLV